VAFELGGERSGLPDTIAEAADLAAAIPLAPGGESLNVAMAGAIALYELRRRSS
jgi:tRNA G18 (ribose-2'-O)-methylase SpoU